MMIFLKKYKPFIILFILLVAIGSVLWFGILPLKQSINKKMRDIQEFYASRENRERQINQLPELRGQYEAIMENEKILDIIIAEGEVVDFVKTLEKLASAMNVKMEITSKDNGKIIEAKKPESKTSQTNDSDQAAVSQGSSKEKIPSIIDSAPLDRYLILNIKTEGRYEDIVAFLGRIETLPFGLDIIKVDMRKKDSEKNPSPIKRGDLANPFSMIGSGSSLPVPEQLPEEEKNKEVVEAVLDMLVYVKN